MKFSPHDYQHHALSWLIQRNLVDGHQGSALFLDPGLGKTAITLAWLNLLKRIGRLKKGALVVAPIRVVHDVWPQEVDYWDQFAHLKTSICHGPIKKRELALRDTDADITLINPDGLHWLEKKIGKKFGQRFDQLVCDESSVFKTWGSRRTKAVRKIAKQIERRLILTGSPSPNGYHDLYAQQFIVDQGAALYQNVTQFRNRYFNQDKYYKYHLKDGAKRLIENKIAPSTLRMSALDNLDLPELLINDVWVRLPQSVRSFYNRFQRAMFAKLDDWDLSAVNAGGRYLLCKQIAGGGAYYFEPNDPLAKVAAKIDRTRLTKELHTAKLDAVGEILGELQGKPAMIAYSYDHDLDRLRRDYPSIPAINRKTTTRQCSQMVLDWNAGRLPLLAVQPAAMSHGLNMQKGPGRDIIWFGMTDNLEHYEQLIRRIWRQGVSSAVRVHRILARGTVDVAVARRIDSKDESQQALFHALKEYRDRVNSGRSDSLDLRTLKAA